MAGTGEKCEGSDATSEQELNRTYKRGISSGLKQASEILLVKAGEAFKVGDDEEAELLRALSKELKEKSEKERPKGVGERG